MGPHVGPVPRYLFGTRGRMDERIFRRLLTVVLVGGGAQLLWRAATG